MNHDAINLSRLQSWMQAVITHPSGIGAGVCAEDAQQNFALTVAQLETVVAPSQSLTGAERLAIYSRAYYARLLDCFRAEFPCLLYALGDELFTSFAIEYLHHHPSQSYTLHHLAEDFSDFLEKTRPDASAPLEERESWPDFIINLARLERTFVEIYDGPGAEDKPPISALQILGIGAEQFTQTRFVPVPCLRLMAFRYPVHAYFAAVREKRAPELPAPADTFLAISRKNYVVRFLDLSAEQYEILQRLIAGLPIKQAVAQASQVTGNSQESLHLKLRDWLCQWANNGLFIA